MRNPFTFRVIPPQAAFCNRAAEIRELVSHAQNGTNVVLFSPRRYGKTSLIRKVQATMEKEGFLTFYADLFMVTSENDIARRISKSIYTVLDRHESILRKGKKILDTFKTFRPVFKPSSTNGFSLTVEAASTSMSGIELLDNVMEELGTFVQKENRRVHIVLDEFQEITELKQSPVEGILRKHIQTHEASYFFVGSRRRVLLDIFNQKKRPFFQSAIMYPLGTLPHDELSDFLMHRFKDGGKKCPKKFAEGICRKVADYPYYAQALAYNVYEVSGKTISAKDIERGYEKLLASERYGYEAIIQGLSATQISLLRALAADPTRKMLSARFMARHRLTAGGIQHARKRLEALDLIEKRKDIWEIVDPVFASWLSTYSAEPVAT